MATQDKTISRIYSISVPGAEKANQQVRLLNEAFEELKSTKMALNKEMATAITSGADASVIQNLKNKILELEKSMKALNGQRITAEKEALAQARAEKELALAKAAEAKAAESQAKAEATRTASIIAQEKELDRQIALEEKQAAALARQKAAVDPLAGSYNALYKEYRELYNLMKASPEGTPVEFRGQLLQFDEAIAKLKELATAEQDFRRQFSRDGLLVGEYTSGIIQAFKDADLGDLIKNQISKGEQELKRLNDEFKETKQRLSDIGISGQGSLEVLEKQLIENRQAAAQLKEQLGKVRNDFSGMGSIGNQVTESLRKGFQGLKKDLVGFVLGFVGFQKILDEARKGYTDASQIEGVKAAFDRLNDPNLLDNLRKATRGTVSDLNLMKQAVRAENFEIPLNQLATLLDFARRRAKETGENVDYLAESIVNGIGRKSPLILDNLGISAVRLKEKFGGVAAEQKSIAEVAQAVSEIIREEQAKAGKEIDTQGEKIAKQTAEWENLRTKFGTKLLPVLTTGLKVLSGVVGVLLAMSGAIVPLTLAVSAYAVAWTVANYALIKTKVVALAARIEITLLNAQANLGTFFTTAYTAAINLFTGATARATAATVLFRMALAGLGIGAVVVVIAALAGAFTTAKAAIDGNTAALKAWAAVNTSASTTIGRQMGVIDAWMKVLNNAKASIETKRDALKNLIAIDPQFKSVLRGQQTEIEKLGQAFFNSANFAKDLAAAYKEVAAGVQLKARAEASAKLVSGSEKRIQDIAAAEQILKGVQFSGGTGYINADILPDEVLKRINAAGSPLRTAGPGQYAVTKQQQQELLKSLGSIREDATKEYLALQQISSETSSELDKRTREQRAQLAQLSEIDIEYLQQQVEDYNRQINTFKGSKAELDALIADREATQKKLDGLLNKNKEGGRGSRLSGDMQDAFKDIDAVRDQQLRDEKIRFQALQEARVTDEQDEIEHLQRIQNINNDATAQKLARLKGSNAAERKAYQELEDARVNAEIETNQKIFELRDAAAKRELDRAKKAAETQLNTVLDSDTSPARKAEAQVVYQQALLQADNRYYDEVIKAAADNKKRVAELEQQKGDALLELNRNLNKSMKQLRQERYNEEVDNIRRIARMQQDILNTQSQQRLLDILRDPKLTTTQKQRGVDRLNRETDINDLSIQIDATDKEIALMKRKYGLFARFNQEYNDLVRYNAELTTRRQELLNDQETASITRAWRAREESLMSYIQQRLDLDAGEMEILRAGGRMAEQLFEGYFDLENQRLEQKREASLKRLEIEKEERLANAQSLSEKETIEKEFAQRTKDVEQQAAKEKKQMALKQLAIDSAVAAIKAFATAPNYIIGAIQAASIGVAYLFNRARIMQQQFEKGGWLRRRFSRGGDVPTRGGEFGGKLHSQGGTPFSFQGTPYEAEVGELAIINRKSAASKRVMTVTGTARQIASAINEEGGGVSFARGAKVLKYAQGGYLGSRLRAPVFVPASTYTNKTENPEGEATLAAIVELGKAISSTADRIDRLEVVQVTSTVTKAQAKEAKAASIGTL